MICCPILSDLRFTIHGFMLPCPCYSRFAIHDSRLLRSMPHALCLCPLPFTIHGLPPTLNISLCFHRIKTGQEDFPESYADGKCSFRLFPVCRLTGTTKFNGSTGKKMKILHVRRPMVNQRMTVCDKVQPDHVFWEERSHGQ